MKKVIGFIILSLFCSCFLACSSNSDVSKVSCPSDPLDTYIPVYDNGVLKICPQSHYFDPISQSYTFECCVMPADISEQTININQRINANGSQSCYFQLNVYSYRLIFFFAQNVVKINGIFIKIFHFYPILLRRIILYLQRKLQQRS